MAMLPCCAREGTQSLLAQHIETHHNDLPDGYRWATEDEMDRPDAIVVKRSVDASGQAYEQDEADVAVPLTYPNQGFAEGVSAAYNANQTIEHEGEPVFGSPDFKYHRWPSNEDVDRPPQTDRCLVCGVHRFSIDPATIEKAKGQCPGHR